MDRMMTGMLAGGMIGVGATMMLADPKARKRIMDDAKKISKSAGNSLSK